jgi:hypothetical protein
LSVDQLSKWLECPVRRDRGLSDLNVVLGSRLATRVSKGTLRETAYGPLNSYVSVSSRT